MTTDNLIIDNSNLFFRTLGKDANPNSKMNYNYEEDGKYTLFKSVFLMHLAKQINATKPQNRIILAIDAKNYWRKELYPLYKANRKKDKADNKFFQGIDFEELFKVTDEFFKELVEVIPQMQYFNVPKAEADDVIAVITKQVVRPTHCISNDKDMTQLYTNSHYEQSLTGNDIKIVKNPKSVLHEFICRGQKKDNIPSIYPRLGTVTYQKKMDDGSLLKLIEEDSEVRELYVRNRQLIDFDYIPQDIQDSIMKEYNSFVPQRTNEYHFMNFLHKHGLNFIIKNYAKSMYIDLKKMWESVDKSGNLFG
jgi:5'-3' exonuclease